MLPEITQSLVDLVAAVPAFGGRVGTTMGGTEADPTMANVELPAAWIVFDGSQDTSQGDGKTAVVGRYQRLQLSYRVVLVLPYGRGESDLIDTQLQTIDDVTAAVRGERPIDGTSGPGAEPWFFQGASLLSIDPDRISYSLAFQTVSFNLKA